MTEDGVRIFIPRFGLDPGEADVTTASKCLRDSQHAARRRIRREDEERRTYLRPSRPHATALSPLVLLGSLSAVDVSRGSR